MGRWILWISGAVIMAGTLATLDVYADMPETLGLLASFVFGIIWTLYCFRR